MTMSPTTSRYNDDPIQIDLQVQRARCIVIGQPGCGKSSVVRRAMSLTQDQLASVDQSRPEVTSRLDNTDHLGPQVHCWSCSDLPVELMLVDFSGRSVYEPWIAQLLSDNGDSWTVIAVFDLTEPSSLNEIRDRMQRLWPTSGKGGKNGKTALSATTGSGSLLATGNASTRLGVLIGTRSDQRDKRQVSSEEALHLARQLEFGYFECSAVEGAEVLQPFQFLAEQLYQSAFPSNVKV
jgi:GTPase SAR1 family protein